MIRKTSDLKQAFATGAMPSGEDFADLIDSFVHTDRLSNEDLQSLREIIDAWRKGKAPRPAPDVTPSPPPPSPRPPAPTPEPLPPDASASLVVSADGQWHALPITDQTPARWLCSAVTCNARPGYRMQNDAIASSQDSGARLIQTVERDTFIPWRTLQFGWQAGAGTTRQLNVRSRSDFGADSSGQPSRILCRWIRQG